MPPVHTSAGGYHSPKLERKEQMNTNHHNDSKELTSAEVIAFLEYEKEQLANYFFLGLGFIAIGALWLAIL